ncbi:MAG: peptidoglycan-binding domain-containing protein, partial [Candidatus Paceibacterota bacterium]
CPNGMTAASNCTTAPVVTTTTETLCPNGMTAASNCTTAPTTVTTTKAPGLIVAQLQKVLKTLRIGERNSDDANALQLFLINQNKGVAAQALAKNGATKYFGPLTRAALIEWQAANQLVADGIFGPKSKAKALGL